MRILFLTFGAVALGLLAFSPAQAKSDMECSRQARAVTGELGGLEYTQVKTACALDEGAWVAVGRPTVVVRENPEPEVVFSASRHVSSGTWVRVSPNRWVLKPR